MKKLTDNDNKNNIWKAYFAEFVGTMLFTYVSCWTIINRDLFSRIHLSPALSPAMVLFVFLWLGSNENFVSLNPAITFALMLLKKLEWAVGIMYIVIQFFGALIGAGFIFIQLNQEDLKSISGRSILGIPGYGPNSSSTLTLYGEFLGSFFLGYIYCSMFAGNRKGLDTATGAGAVAMTLFLTLLTLNEITGASMNPIRCLAPAIISGRLSPIQFSQLIGPVIGCLIGAVIQTSIYMDEKEELEEERRIISESRRRLKRPEFDKEIELDEK